MKKMQTMISKRGQTVIPVQIRKRYGITAGDRLIWLDDSQVIKVILASSDPIRALRGRGKGENLLEALLKLRQEEQ
jgi:bifunctional DNA-binding transcriptional regulator/antitoxin component of YhaV-PrlF toxin-antitoxin module